jgi:UDP-N-acetylglucosamine diphosphorylase/glucosamine-1-phosphate N-acetyltransferase
MQNMRLILVDRPAEERRNFYPLALGRPVFELRVGMTTLAEKLVRRFAASDVACFVPPYLADVYRVQTAWPVNDAGKLRGEDLLVVDGRVKASAAGPDASGPSRVARNAKGQVLAAWIRREDLAGIDAGTIDSLLLSAGERLPGGAEAPPTWNYTWDLVLGNPAELVEDFRIAGRSGIEGKVEEPAALRGSRSDVYVAPGALVHPLVVIDAEHGPVYIDEGAEIHPFTRIEGPCYIGKKSILLGAKCREGNSIGPMCRVGGEVEESIIHGYSNKYHDGFLGHAYVGQWVNLGALTTNSDLKNDYSNVAVTLDGRTNIDTGSTKVGALIGDHTKTSIGCLLNTGACVGAMTLIAATGRLLPKFIPSFAWLLEGVVTKGFGRKRLFQTAATAMGRRKCRWSEADEALWEEVFRITAPERDEAVDKGRREMAAKTRD